MINTPPHHGYVENVCVDTPTPQPLGNRDQFGQGCWLEKGHAGNHCRIKDQSGEVAELGATIGSESGATQRVESLAATDKRAVTGTPETASPDPYAALIARLNITNRELGIEPVIGWALRMKASNGLDEAAAAIAALVQERDNSRALVKDICAEWNEDCEPCCDSYGHDENCKATFIAAAKRDLNARAERAKRELAAALAECERLRKDAERYRFICAELDRTDPMISAVCKVGFDRQSSEWANFANSASLSHAIDAARSKP